MWQEVEASAGQGNASSFVARTDGAGDVAQVIELMFLEHRVEDVERLRLVAVQLAADGAER